MTKQEIAERLKVLQFARRSLSTKLGRVRREMKELEQRTPTKETER